VTAEKLILRALGADEPLEASEEAKVEGLRRPRRSPK
jgi:hypothetical protein